MKQGPLFKYLFLAIFVFLSLGCKEELPNPETLDKIYNDLLSEKKEVGKSLKEEEGTLASLFEERKKVAPRSIERRVNIKGIKKSRKKVVKLRQRLKYLDIRARRRLVETRKSYRIAFKQEKPWPDPKEYEYYQTQKRLRSAPRNWALRVPKLHARNPNHKDKK